LYQKTAQLLTDYFNIKYIIQTLYSRSLKELLMKRKYLALSIILLGSSLYGRVSAANMPEDLTCITYQLKQATDESKGQEPPAEEWLERVVAVENSVLFLHKLSKIERSKVIDYYLLTLDRDPNSVADIARFIDHICMTKMSDSERMWLAEELKRNVGNF
jgi:hypothetical protein